MTYDAKCVPSSERVEPGSYPLPTANFPVSPAESNVDAETVASEWVEAFNKTIHSDLTGVSDLFLQESYWRDQLCLSWDLRTLQGPEKIKIFLSDSTSSHRIKSVGVDQSAAHRAPTATALDAEGKTHAVQAFLSIVSDVGPGGGVVRLVQDHGLWKVFTLFTFLKELKGYEEFIGKRRPHGVQYGEHSQRLNWLEKRKADTTFEDGLEPTVLILGSYHLPYFSYIGLTLSRCRPGWPHNCGSTKDAGNRVTNCRSRRAHGRQLAKQIPPFSPTRPSLVRPSSISSVSAQLAHLYA